MMDKQKKIDEYLKKDKKIKNQMVQYYLSQEVIFKGIFEEFIMIPTELVIFFYK